MNLARHPQVLTLLSVGRPTAPHGFTLGGNEGDKHWSSASHAILSANVVTRSKAKSAVSTPRDVASPLARWTAQTLFGPSSGTHSSHQLVAPIELARPIDDMAVSEFILQRQAIPRFVRDALQSRLCINYRMVNELTRLMVYLMPLVNELLKDLDKTLWY